MHHHRDCRCGSPQMHVRAVLAILIHIHARHALAKAVSSRDCERANHAEPNLSQQNHRVPPSGPLLFLESIQMRTVFSSSFTETSSVSPCDESMRRPATRSSSSFLPDSSASTTESGIFTSTCETFPAAEPLPELSPCFLPF